MLLILYGAGGVGSEVLEIAKRVNSQSQEYENIFFAMDNPPIDNYCGIKVLDVEDVFHEQPIDTVRFSICIGEPAYRLQMWERVRSRGYQMATLIHPDVDVPVTAQIGEGCQIYKGSYIGPHAKIGNDTLVILASIGHDTIIGNHCVLALEGRLAGRCVVGDESFIGAGSSVIQGTTIGDHAVIGMASAVFRDVPDEAIVLGNPARVIGMNKEHKVF